MRNEATARCIMRHVPRVSRSLVIALAIAAGACRHQLPRGAPEHPVALLVRNHGFFDVDVYALPSALSSRVRLATVTGNSDARLSVPAHAMRPGGGLVVYLHAVGSRASWISPEVAVTSGLTACLDIFANTDGSLSRSSLYTIISSIATTSPELMTTTDGSGDARVCGD
jgi:hypothetical protein